MAALVNGVPTVIEEKHPSEIVRLQLEWTDFAGGASISNSTWVDALPDAGLTLSGAQVDEFKTSTLVSDGIVGQTGYIENHVTFADGRIAVFTFCVVVATKVPV